jgi:hypothetical protein
LGVDVPALDEFYAAPSNEQKARFTTTNRKPLTATLIADEVIE